MIVDFHGFSKARLISGDRGLSWEPPVFRQVTSITPGSSWSTSVLPVSKATPWALLDKIPTGRRKNSTGSMKTQPLRIPIDERLCRDMFFFLKPMPSVYGISILVSLASTVPRSIPISNLASIVHRRQPVVTYSAIEECQRNACLRQLIQDIQPVVAKHSKHLARHKFSTHMLHRKQTFGALGAQVLLGVPYTSAIDMWSKGHRSWVLWDSSWSG